MDVLDDFVGALDADIVVATTIDPAMQNAAERALVDELNEKGQKFNVSQGAFVAMQPDGALRALVGGRNYEASQFNRATVARRQPGSSFKPFVYLTAIEAGLTPDTVREDSPVRYKGWAPENYDHGYRGAITLRDALALSLNTVAVKLGLEVGPKAVVQTAQRLGISSPLQANPSLALGTSEVTPLELVSAYAAFANGGMGVIPYVITQVRTTDGKVVYQRPSGSGGLGRVIDPGAVAMMNEMMHNTFVIGTARKAQIPGWILAGKTGTTQDYKDAWFMGFSGNLVAGVWLGNDDGTLTRRVTGGNLPTEVWHSFMQAALKGKQPVGLPGSDRFGPAEAPVAGGPGGFAGAGAGESAWIQPRPAPRGNSEKNFLEKLFGL
jgi:penicillin-binding protein 1A